MPTLKREVLKPIPGNAAYHRLEPDVEFLDRVRGTKKWLEVSSTDRRYIQSAIREELDRLVWNALKMQRKLVLVTTD